jgi:hypothetical protein
MLPVGGVIAVNRCQGRRAQKPLYLAVVLIMLAEAILTVDWNALELLLQGEVR